MSPCQLLRAPRPTRPPLPCTCACAQLCVASRVTQRTRHHPEHLHVRVLVAHLCPRAPRNRVSISAVPPLGSRQAGTAPARGGPPPRRAELQPLLPAGRARGQPCRTAAGCPFCTVGVTLRASACGLLRGRAALWEEHQECGHAVCDSRGLGSGGSHGCFPGARGSAASRTVLASGCRLLPALGTVRCGLIGDASGVSPPSLPEVSAEAPMPQHGPRRVPHPPAQGIPALSPAVPAPERLGDLPKSATSLFLVTGFLVRMSSSGATAAPRPGVPVSAPALPPGPPAWGWAPH